MPIIEWSLVDKIQREYNNIILDQIFKLAEKSGYDTGKRSSWVNQHVLRGKTSISKAYAKNFHLNITYNVTIDKKNDAAITNISLLEQGEPPEIDGIFNEFIHNLRVAHEKNNLLEFEFGEQKTTLTQIVTIGYTDLYGGKDTNGIII